MKVGTHSACITLNPSQEDWKREKGEETLYGLIRRTTIMLKLVSGKNFLRF